jgi:hypothetical protein
MGPPGRDQRQTDDRKAVPRRFDGDPLARQSGPDTQKVGLKDLHDLFLNEW